MINFDCILKENIKVYNQNCPQILDHTYRILIIGISRSGKTNSLFNVINQQPDIDKIYLYAKDVNEAKYQFFKNVEMLEQSSLMILKLLLNIQVKWSISYR